MIDEFFFGKLDKIWNRTVGGDFLVSSFYFFDLRKNKIPKFKENLNSPSKKKYKKNGFMPIFGCSKRC